MKANKKRNSKNARSIERGVKETAYLLGSKENARRLLDSIAQLEAGKLTFRKLADSAEG